jgi:hypothetical protein
LSEIDLHDARHSYATPGPDAKIDWKALSQQIGHADVAFTMKQYVQTDLEANGQVANTLAELIIGGSLASFEITETDRASNPSPDGRSRPRQDGRTPFSPWTAPTFWSAPRAPRSASWSRSRRCRTV